MVNKMKSVRPDPNSVYDQGYYKLVNESKYKCIDKTIIYRSSLEKKFCQLCDKSSKIVAWASEPFPISYEHPFEIDRNTLKPKVCNYYPDYYIELLNDGIIKKMIIEIKPQSLIDKPNPLNKNATLKQKENYNKKLKTILINRKKATTASKFCAERGFTYIFITEKFIDSLKLS